MFKNERSVGTQCLIHYDIPNTYSQIYLEFVFAVKGRECNRRIHSFLEKFEIEFDQKYVFEFFD
jgi:hypothetical protein